MHLTESSLFFCLAVLVEAGNDGDQSVQPTCVESVPDSPAPRAMRAHSKFLKIHCITLQARKTKQCVDQLAVMSRKKEAASFDE